jgi:hypothetical protein
MQVMIAMNQRPAGGPSLFGATALGVLLALGRAAVTGGAPATQLMEPITFAPYCT